jgi:hypothetical protein
MVSFDPCKAIGDVFYRGETRELKAFLIVGLVNVTLLRVTLANEILFPPNWSHHSFPPTRSNRVLPRAIRYLSIAELINHRGSRSWTGSRSKVTGDPNSVFPPLANPGKLGSTLFRKSTVRAKWLFVKDHFQSVFVSDIEIGPHHEEAATLFDRGLLKALGLHEKVAIRPYRLKDPRCTRCCPDHVQCCIDGRDRSL